MTITDDDIRTALDRAVDRAELDRPIAPVAELRERRRWAGVLAAAAAIVVVAAVVGVVAGRDGERVRTGRTDPASSTSGPADPASSTTSAGSPAASAAPDPSTQRVLVLNGGEDAFEADDLTQQLAAIGYQTQTAFTARDLVDPTTIYYAPGHEIAARDLGARIDQPWFEPQPGVPLGTGPTEDADLIVVLGRTWVPTELHAPAADATYETTTTSPNPVVDEDAALWRGTAADAEERATPEGAVRALFRALRPPLTVQDVAVQPGSTSGWKTATVQLDRGPLLSIQLMPGSDGWWVTQVISDAADPDLGRDTRVSGDGTVYVVTPEGTTSVHVYDLDGDRVGVGGYIGQAGVTTLEGIDSTRTVFRLPNKASATTLTRHLLTGRDEEGRITTVQPLLLHR